MYQEIAFFFTGELHKVWRVCDITWDGHNGIYGLCFVFHVGKPWQASDTHWISGMNVEKKWHNHTDIVLH